MMLGSAEEEDVDPEVKDLYNLYFAATNQTHSIDQYHPPADSRAFKTVRDVLMIGSALISSLPGFLPFSARKERSHDFI